LGWIIGDKKQSEGLLAMMGGCGEDRLRKFERNLGLLLPDDYAQFLMNGSDEDFDRNFKVFAPDYSFISQTFSAFLRITDDLNRGLGGYIGKDVIPPALLAIGHDYASNVFMMSLDADDYGSIFWVNQEWGWTFHGEEPALKDPAFIVADSFTLFLEWLRAGGGPRCTASNI
jgi:SMI1 / KNR4 family (SUKH-1)